jgi:hypothetical protein
MYKLVRAGASLVQTTLAVTKELLVATYQPSEDTTKLTLQAG